MKTLFFIPYLFMFSIVIGQSDKIIGRPIRIGSLEIAQNDFPALMNWQEANKACDDLGNGWRLPTINELQMMKQNEDKIAGFPKSGYYWSSTINETYFCYPNYTRSLEESLFHSPNNLSTYNVRAVRSF